MFSFGVLIWELETKCSCKPLSWLPSDAKRYRAALHPREHLHLPATADPEIATLFWRCISETAAERPGFKEIMDIINAVVERVKAEPDP